MLTALRKKVARSLRQRGVLGTAGLALRAAVGAARDLTPARRRAREADRTWDRAHGVDTSGRVSLAGLRVAAGDWEESVDYEPINPDAFRRLLEAAGGAGLVPGRTFVDLGCGKGRALLLAAEYPFRRVVGVEFSPLLAEAARRNVASCRGLRRACPDVDVLVGDAAEYPFPGGPLVVFLYNPFGAQTMARVAENLRRSLEADPRPAAVLYDTPAHPAVWDALTGFRRTAGGRGYRIYQTGPAAPPPGSGAGR